MNRRLSVLAIALLMIVAFGTGCIGNFALSGKVRKFNLDLTPDRFGREIAFVILYVIPVYPIAGAIDIIVINSIEFWTGENPVDGSKSVTPISKQWTTDDGTEITMQGLPDESIDVTVVSPSGDEQFFNLVRTDDGVVARDREGNTIVSAAELRLAEIEQQL